MIPYTTGFCEDLADTVKSCEARRRSPAGELAEKLCNFVLHNENVFTFTDNGEMVVYDRELGYYKEDADKDIETFIQASFTFAQIKKTLNCHITNETLAHIRRSTYISRDDFQAPPNLICLSNGVLDMNTLKLSPHKPEARFLSKLPIAYKQDADCPKTKQFLSEVMEKRVEVDSIFELYGYSLIRDYRFQKSFMLLGTGSNGKSTLLSHYERFLGVENTSHVALQDFAVNRFASGTLYRKFANIYADLPPGAIKDSGRFKMLCGGDRIVGENKFEDSFSFHNHAKLVFSCNALPQTHDDSDAFYRRWIIIEFLKQFVGKSEKRGLLGEITTPEEMSGVLNEAIKGWKRLALLNEFSCAGTIEEMRERYIRKSDPIRSFLMDEIEPELDGEIPKAELWMSFLKYCGEKHLQPPAERTFWFRIPQALQISYSRPLVNGVRVQAIRGIKWKVKEEDVVAPKPEMEKHGLKDYVK